MPDQLPPTGAVFLSYASEDAEAAARICEALRAAGIEVWFDRNELRGGDAWDSKIKKQIHDCALFVPLISAHTNARIEGYFRGEWTLATRRLVNRARDATFLVPVVIDETREADARVPEEFLDAQWTWLRGGETPPAFAQRVRQLLGGDRAPVQTQETATGETEPSVRKAGPVRPRPWYADTPGKRRVRRMGLATIAVLLVIVGGAFWYFRGASDPPTAKPPSVLTSPIAAAVPHKKSIAVLPFVNMSSDKEQEFFSDGLSEELLNLLAKVPDLRVAARTSSFYFKGKDVKLPDIARELQVAHLLEGSVRKSGDRVRITAQLIRASDGYHQWSETYDRTLVDVFAVQEEIARAVVSELKATLMGAPPTVHKTTPEAYAFYLQAKQLDRLSSTDRVDEAIALYQKALAIDPSYAPAWLWLGEKFIAQGESGVRPLDEGVKLAREAFGKAMAIDPDFAAAHAAFGWLALTYDNDLAASARHLEHALALDSKDMVTLLVGLQLNDALNRTEENVELAEYIVSRDPMDSINHAVLASNYMQAGRFDDAIASFRAELKLVPDTGGTHAAIGDVLLLKGKYEAAIAEYKVDPNNNVRLSGLACAYHALGQKRASDAALNELIEKYPNNSVLIAMTFAYLGQVDRAFEWLNRAASRRETFLAPVASTLWLKNLHKDPRWLPFLRKIGKAPEQLAAIEFDLKVPTH